jgi:hypothetical protein
MNRDGEFDNTQRGAEMATRYRDRVDGFRPQFIGQLLELIPREVAHIRGDFHPVQKRCPRRHYERAPQRRAVIIRILVLSFAKPDFQSLCQYDHTDPNLPCIHRHIRDRKLKCQHPPQACRSGMLTVDALNINVLLTLMLADWGSNDLLLVTERLAA